ncbi:Membrane dipeptidase (Peptidase family M19) [Gemmata sp. SH-PL17]|uniref:dipeptidase n=1 Tax=Gemmata sp. SH-PL17 TaxID=1630693 RepID=UPI00078B29CF|nr:dipeptidase [Gemmata sp. SH-PL17]AMV28062.1 Membrane dipeptidase (Peptidase family M19) [Gemmata sp. SH-PL17]
MYRLFFASLSLVAAVGLLRAPAGDAPARSKTVVVSEQALAIHNDALLIDGHNDLPWELRENDGPGFKNIDLTKPQKKFHTDIPRLKKGNVGAQFWSAYVPSSTAKKGTAVKMTLEQIDVVHELARRYPDTFEMAYGTEDIRRVRKAGKVACLIGIEGGHAIDNSLPLLRDYYRLGVRYMTLTHSESLDWADSCSDEPRANGLTPFGVDVVHEMNRLGMLVDLSHVSPATMKAALKATKAPVIFSHSSAFAVADHARNVPDDVLKLVKENRGVVMVNFYSGFLTPEGARAMKLMFEKGRELRKQFPTDDAKYREAFRAWSKDNDYPAGDVHNIVDHIDHIVKTAGIDCAGIGSDFDGVPKLPTQMNDVSCYPLLTQIMLDRGYTKEQIHKVLGGNLMRVFAEAEKVSREWNKAGQ